MIRKLTQEEYNNAADLSYQVCMERNDFTQEGIETFKSFVYDTSLMNTLDIYGAFDNHLLIGIIGVHRERQHISLFFVLPHYHRRGIGTLLSTLAFSSHHMEPNRTNGINSPVRNSDVLNGRNS